MRSKNVATRHILFFSTLLLSAMLGSGCKCQSGNSGGGPLIIECGGGAAFPCPPGMFCQLGQECGGIDHRGKCVVQPTDCPEEDNPVCGCDNLSYNSRCYANAAGVSVDYTGPCIAKPTGETR